MYFDKNLFSFSYSSNGLPFTHTLIRWARRFCSFFLMYFRLNTHHFSDCVSPSRRRWRIGCWRQYWGEEAALVVFILFQGGGAKAAVWISPRRERTLGAAAFRCGPKYSDSSILAASFEVNFNRLSFIGGRAVASPNVCLFYNHHFHIWDVCIVDYTQFNSDSNCVLWINSVFDFICVIVKQFYEYKWSSNYLHWSMKQIHSDFCLKKVSFFSYLA